MSHNIRCAPNKNYDNGTCFTLDNLKKMSSAYNNSSNGKINPIKINNNKQFLVSELNNRFSNCNNDQLCWLKQSTISRIDDDDLHFNTFLPQGPQGQFDWLSTTNINEVMFQYESKNSDFKFLGAVPIDFDDLPILGIKDLDFSKMKETGINKVGIVFNLDEHYKSGSHWVASFIDFEKNNVYFFDSYASKPNNRVIKLFSRVVKSMMKTNNVNMNDIDIRHNIHRHQYGSSECGVYSINFILRLLKGESFDTITEMKTSDEEINKCRSVYFKGGAKRG